MASEWRDVTIESIATRIAMGPFGSDIKTDNFVPSGVPVIRGGNLTDGRFNGTGFVFLTEEKANDLANANAFPGDIVLTHRGTLGQVGIIPREPFPRYVVSQSQMKLTCDQSQAISEFIYYYFKSPTGQNALLMNTSQTGVPAISRPVTSLKGIQLSLPPIKEQRAIAHVLGTLDDKIELNRKQNEALEAMARALFKAWFVDFAPVRAKMGGRWQQGQTLPSLPAHLYDIFPDRLVDSEFGEVPDGWRYSTIGAEVSVLGGSTPSTKEADFWEGGHHCWATPKDLSALKFPVLLDTDRKISDAGLAKISSSLLPVGTVLLSSRAPIGYLAITEVPTAINQGFIAMKCDGILPNVFVLAWCRESMDAIVGNANGSTFQEISKSNFRPLPVVVPSEPVLESYRKSAGSLYRQMAENERESRSLAQLRDTLLPKLVAGELCIADAKKFIERAERQAASQTGSMS